MRATRLLVAGWVLVAMAYLLASCGGRIGRDTVGGDAGADAGGCTAGSEAECRCPDGGQGVQVCTADGTQWQSCECAPDAPTGGTSSGGAGGRGGTTTGGTGTTTGGTGGIAPNPGTITRAVMGDPDPDPKSDIVPAGYTLVWSDEFDGDAITLDNWTFDVGDWGWGDAAEPFFTNGDNFAVQDGVGVLEARIEDGGYTVARVSSQGKVMYQYGYIEVKMRAPEGTGVLASVWTYGESFPPYHDYYRPANPEPWPDCGEIDIYVARTGSGGDLSDTHYVGAVHYFGTDDVVYGSGAYDHSEKLSLRFHLYSILWDATSIRYYFDGNQFWEFDITAPEKTEFHRPHFLLVSIDVGGNYQGYNVDDSIFPMTMEIDYIRWYQANQGN